MSNENELLEPLATEAGQLAIARAINNLSSLEYAVRAERAATTATQKADEASNSADDASDYATEARNWATKTGGYVDQETITIPPEQEGDEPTTETIDLYSARYYAALAEETYNNMQFDNTPTENSTNLLSSGTIYTALNGKADKSNTYTKTEVDTLISTAVSDLVNSAPSTLDTLEELANALGDDPNFATTIATQLGNKADKSDTYTKTEVDTALGNVQSTLTFDNTPTANSNNPVKSSGIKTALDGKQDTLTFDSTPTSGSTNPVTSGGIYTALQNVDIDIDDEITEDSDNPVTSAAIYEALQNFTPSGGGEGSYITNSDGDKLFEDKQVGQAAWATYQTVDLSKYDALKLVFKSGLDDSVVINSVFPSYYINRYTSGGSGKFITVGTFEGKEVNIYFGLTLIALSINGTTTNNLKCDAYGIKFYKNLSEQMYSNVLYDNSSGWNSGSITLSDSLENYDFIEFLFGNNSDVGHLINSVINAKVLYDRVGQKYDITGYSNRYFNFVVTSKTQLTYDAREWYVVYKIIGHKMAKGGYSGIVSDARMTVKSGTVEHTSTLSGNATVNLPVVFDSPMPDTNYIVQVTPNFGGTGWANAEVTTENKTINGFNIIIFGMHGSTTVKPKYDWIAIRPNSYTREGMVEDVLFSSTTGVSSGTINLSGNISDYDLIQFIVDRSNSSNSLNVFQNTFLAGSLCEYTGTTSLGKTITVHGFDQDYLKMTYVNDNTLNIFESLYQKLLKVVGIKFGRYVSGVAVDTTVTQNSDAVVTSGAVYDALLNAGGGSSVTVDSTITQGGTNPVEGGAIYTALGDKADKSTTYTKTEVDTAIASKGDVTTNTDQNITGTKTFVGSKKVGFKLSTANDKLGFTLYGNTGTERGYLEFNPTNTIDGVAGLMTLGNYATSAGALTHVGFRRYSNISGASGAYNLLTPLIADAKSPFSLTTTYQNFYLPLGFTDGTTTVKTAKSGVVDLSPLLSSLELRIAALEANQS